MTDKEIIIDGIRLEDIKNLLYTGQKMAISTKTFEAIIEQLQRKEQECEELRGKVNNYEIYGSPVVVAPQNHTNTEFDLLLGKYLRYKQALENIEDYCNEQNLKMDYTACQILKIIGD